MPSMDLAAGISAFQQAFNNERGWQRQQFLEDQRLDMERQRLALEQSRIQAVIDQMQFQTEAAQREEQRLTTPAYPSPMDTRQQDLGYAMAPRQVSPYEAQQELPMVYADIASKRGLSDEEMARLRLEMDKAAEQRDIFMNQLRGMEYVNSMLQPSVPPSAYLEYGWDPLTGEPTPDRLNQVTAIGRELDKSKIMSNLPQYAQTLDLVGEYSKIPRERINAMIQGQLSGFEYSPEEMQQLQDLGFISPAQMRTQTLAAPQGPIGPQAMPEQLRSAAGMSYTIPGGQPLPPKLRSIVEGIYGERDRQQAAVEKAAQQAAVEKAAKERQQLLMYSRGRK